CLLPADGLLESTLFLQDAAARRRRGILGAKPRAGPDLVGVQCAQQLSLDPRRRVCSAPAAVSSSSSWPRWVSRRWWTKACRGVPPFLRPLLTRIFRRPRTDCW